MAVRLFTCSELAEDPTAIAELMEHYSNLEKSATPVALLLPWFNGPAKRLNKQSMAGLYSFILKYVEDKRKGSNAQDPIDVFIQNGISNEVIIDVSFDFSMVPWSHDILSVSSESDNPEDNLRWGIQHKRELCVCSSSKIRLSKLAMPMFQPAGPSCT